MENSNSARLNKRLGVSVTLVLVLTIFAMIGPVAATSAKLDYHIATSFIADGTGIPQTGARAEADNRDKVSVTGLGTFNTASGTATGGGSFVHTDKHGRLVGFGTWTSSEVVSFTFYGCGIAGGTPLPASFCGGLLVLKVHLVAAGGAPAFDGVLTVDCAIGANAPLGAGDSITLDVPGVINFDEPILEPSGLTLYLSRSQNPA